ncbi:oxidoreductase domain protein [Nitrosopumilus maritimus SCM1]|uniref:Oxidoreductase domain protein n=2 Tax=Nitrosopumilus maritimus TaxID=338192 RepID=A9A1U6_NITMS|nr:oxidoreductase domain protein [Nitrosopumilus maritimus SCM1]
MEFHIQALRKSGLNPIAIASSNPNSLTYEKFAKKNKISKTFQNWKDMVKNENYDGILIATKIECTFEILNFCLKKNVPILVEKPVGFNSIKLKKIIQKSHGMVMVGYNRRFYKPINYLKNLLLKNCNPVIANMVVPEIPGEKNFYSNSTHSIDILRYIFGEIKLEFVKKLIKNNKILGFVATFSNQNQDLINFIGNWNSSDNFSLSLYQNTKKFELKPFEQLNIFDGIKIIEPTKTNPIRQYVPKLQKTITLDKMDVLLKPGFYLQAKAFAKLIKTRQKNDYSATLSDAMKNLELCEKLIGKLRI